ncbi:MAG: DJ-1/PfpI family protein [Tannerella sp.]|jgi:putative intracellular protease/amidase|nr:DJ-1/PfpI family protein [Tannerella sp.]
MAKKTAVLVVNPVNGFGLFQYLESFFENGIPFKTFAVAGTTQVKTNSGVALQTDDIVANLKGRESGYDALVFACGDAMPKFSENAGKPYNQDMTAVVKAFDAQGKIIIGHCAAAMMFDAIGVGTGKKVALHPYAKPHVKNVVGTGTEYEIDGNLYTAQTENHLWTLMPKVIDALK